ncbi:OmpA family protein [Vibrio parahaemolyticus]|uniref:OmpA family protein n=1 Tax=Vibrio parahaemolyticus TaxID=670 RepID=UPI00084B7759|nr:OmpA family protein [Vibrio parahaemolyticus]EGR2914243.1 OmpA family protein [Vibrio parahaemolyticus]EGR3154879.1 OmpA family protein [Vibrio parahaemolyticus]EIE1208788.1 OmpA family protein [Vibrio parahaemolyticus]EIZ1317593.1 OmpA family protein [Vibrio parahaemolyticus]EJC7075673.1 OmpA family protein [Vibrio parahaemolyticus]
MKKLVIGAFAISTLPFSLIVKAEEGISVYCDNTFSEYQHSIKVDDVVGIAQHRQGFLQIEQKSNNGELKQALAGKSKLGLDQIGCKTWIGNQNNNHQGDGLVARLHFGFDKSNLTPMGSKALSLLAGSLKNSDSAIAVDGHTDSKGSEGYNQILGLQRALTTSDGLIAQGVDKSRVIVRSFGETQPIASNSTAEGRVQNRRSEIWVSNGEQVKPDEVKPTE